MSKQKKKRKSKQKFRDHMTAAVSKIRRFKAWEEKELILMAEQNRSVIVNYLIWHTWSRVGLVKFCNSLHFYMRMKLAQKSERGSEDDLLTIWVDYGEDPNDYDKMGLIEMVRFNPVDGFQAVL